MSTTDTVTTPAPANTRGRVILASLIGTSIEFYDFYVYATAAVLVFPALFFTSEDPTTALLASFAVFGVAFIARLRRGNALRDRASSARPRSNRLA